MKHDPVTSLLSIGSIPDPRKRYYEFDLIALCAKEVQIDLPKFQGLVIRPAFDDTPWPTEDDVKSAVRAARVVAQGLKKRKRALVTCRMGLNRSALVAGLALRLTSKLSASEIICKIRAARGGNALSNPTFESMIHRFRGKK